MTKCIICKHHSKNDYLFFNNFINYYIQSLLKLFLAFDLFIVLAGTDQLLQGSFRLHVKLT